MNKEVIITIILFAAIVFVSFNINNIIYTELHGLDGCIKDAKDLEFPIGQRVYSPNHRLYGVVDSLNDDCSVLGINWDNTRISQQGVNDYIKVTNGTYLNLTEYPNDGTPPTDPCDNPASEDVARACVGIMESRYR